ncbi:hypothetical protein C8R47DRAFT_1245366 [Mycena vitilis]|nr:hypothetical protein C8R47DRAFT_1245366 [Mycena vitilis]
MASSPVPALPNVELSYGPMLIGVFLNMILYGVLIAQTLTFYQLYKKDNEHFSTGIPPGSGGSHGRPYPFPVDTHPYQVGFLFFVLTANTGLSIAMLYQPLILEYGKSLTFSLPVFFPTVFMTKSLSVVLVSMPIQLFFAFRIHKLTKSLRIPTIIIALFATTSFGDGIWTTVMVAILKEFAKKPLLHTPALVWFLTYCAADILITTSLVITLARKKTGFTATDSVVDKVIRTTIQTGLITAVFSILEVICFMVYPHFAINQDLVFDMQLVKPTATSTRASSSIASGTRQASSNSAARSCPAGSTKSLHQGRFTLI